MYIQINIGRNFQPNKFNLIGGTHSDVEWEEFIKDATHIVEQFQLQTDVYGTTLPQVHLGIGEWDGVPEDSAHISAYHEGGFDTDGLSEWVYRLKKQYSQDNIAVIFGSKLI